MMVNGLLNGFTYKQGYPNSWMIYNGNIPLKWMMTGATPMAMESPYGAVLKMGAPSKRSSRHGYQVSFWDA